MAYALVAHAAAGNAGSGATTGAINTTGATLLVVCAQDFNGIGTVTDSKGNTWVKRTDPGGAARACLFDCKNPIVGTGHTFSLSGSLQSLYVAAFSGADVTAPFNKESGANGATQPGSLTPDYANCLVVTAIDVTNGAAPSVDSGFTITDSLVNPGTYFTGAMAYKVQTSAAAVNPTWSVSGRVVMAVYAPAGTSPHMSYTTPQAITVRTAMTTTPTNDGGGTSPGYTLQSGTLPPGCTLDASTGVISGTPTTKGTGTYTPTIRLTTSTGTFDFQITFNVTAWTAGTKTPIFAYEADQITGVADGATLVAGNVLDTTGNGKNVASIAGTGPVYRATGSAIGTPCMEFGGLGELITPAVGAAFLAKHTVIVVMEKTGGGAECIVGSGTPGSDLWMLGMADATRPRVVATDSGTVDQVVGAATRTFTGLGVVMTAQTFGTSKTAHLFINGVNAGGTDQNVSLPPQQQALHIGGVNSTLRLNGKILRIFAFGENLSANELNLWRTYINGRDGALLQLLKAQLFFDGDSITKGITFNGPPFRSVVGDYFSALGVYSLSWGSPSDKLNHDISDRYAPQIAPLFASGMPNCLVGFMGTNDIDGGATGAATYTNMVTYGQTAQGTGFKFIAPTMLPRGAPNETQRNIFNSAMRAGWATYSDAQCDWGDQTIPLQDGIHPTANSQGVVMPPYLISPLGPLLLDPPNISYTTPVAGAVGSLLGAQSPTNTGGASVTWTLDSGSFPPGIGPINATTGVVPAGTPTAGGTYVATAKAANDAGFDTFAITFVIAGNDPNPSVPGSNRRGGGNAFIRAIRRTGIREPTFNTPGRGSPGR